MKIDTSRTIWSKKLKRMYEDTPEEQLLEWWPTEDDYTAFETESKRNWLLGNILRDLAENYFDEDIYESDIRKFKKGNGVVRKKIYKLLSKWDRVDVKDAIASYYFRNRTEVRYARAFRSLLKNQLFNEEILKIRKSFGIIGTDFIWSKNDLEILNSDPFDEVLWPDVTRLATKYGFKRLLGHAIRQYIKFDKVTVNDVFAEDICSLQNRADKEEEVDVETFPVAIYVNSIATITDIHEYIDRNKKIIETLLAKHQLPHFPKRRNRIKPAQEKTEYIWRNQSIRPARKLADMVNKKFHTDHDAIYIRNTISKQNKIRGKRTM